MKKFLLSVFALLVAMTAFPADNYQLTNANFEDWSGAAFDGEAQPKGWNASHVEQVGMKFNFAHKETGRNGGFCLMVQDQEVGALGITEVSPGYFSIGKPWAYLPVLPQSIRQRPVHPADRLGHIVQTLCLSGSSVPETTGTKRTSISFITPG